MVAALAAGCADGKPRTLPFPQLDARAPFPELVGRTGEAATAVPRQTSFADRLAPSGPASTEGAAADAARRVLPLGKQLFGEIPSDPAWSWQEVEDGVTLVACRLPDNSLAALVYAEAFPSRMRIAPSEEIQRFQITVNPEGASRRLTPSAVAGSLTGSLVGQVAKGTGSDRTDAARLLQLLATRTAGAGLGFHSAPGSFTGWKWVGKNGKSVTVRLARFTGIWERQASLPAEIAHHLEVLRKIPGVQAAAERLDAPSPSSGAAAAGGVSAYLLVGSATDSSEQSGAHLALLWQQSSLQCIEGLSSFLASLGPVRPGSTQQLGMDGQAYDLPQTVGLQLVPGEAVVSLDEIQKPAGKPAAPPATAPAR